MWFRSLKLILYSLLSLIKTSKTPLSSRMSAFWGSVSKCYSVFQQFGCIAEKLRFMSKDSSLEVSMWPIWHLNIMQSSIMDSITLESILIRCIHLRTWCNFGWIDKGVLSHAHIFFNKWCLFCLPFSVHSQCPSAILYSSQQLSTKQTLKTCLLNLKLTQQRLDLDSSILSFLTALIYHYFLYILVAFYNW